MKYELLHLCTIVRNRTGIPVALKRCSIVRCPAGVESDATASPSDTTVFTAPGDPAGLRDLQLAHEARPRRAPRAIQQSRRVDVRLRMRGERKPARGAQVGGSARRPCCPQPSRRAGGASARSPLSSVPGAAASARCMGAFYSITSSASARSFGGILSPSALATTTLMTSSNLLGISTGKSPGFAPLRMRGT